jgi:hypothetical protein
MSSGSLPAWPLCINSRWLSQHCYISGEQRDARGWFDLLNIYIYFSPACILSFLVIAVARGELNEAWAWSDAPVVDSSQDDKSASLEKKVN